MMHFAHGRCASMIFEIEDDPSIFEKDPTMCSQAFRGMV